MAHSGGECKIFHTVLPGVQGGRQVSTGTTGRQLGQSSWALACLMDTHPLVQRHFFFITKSTQYVVKGHETERTLILPQKSHVWKYSTICCFGN